MQVLCTSTQAANNTYIIWVQHIVLFSSCFLLGIVENLLMSSMKVLCMNSIRLLQEMHFSWLNRFVGYSPENFLKSIRHWVNLCYKLWLIPFWIFLCTRLFQLKTILANSACNIDGILMKSTDTDHLFTTELMASAHGTKPDHTNM